MKESTVDVLGGQIISNEIAVVSMLQVLAHTEPAIGKGLVRALRENSSRIPPNFQCALEWIERYVELLQNQLPAQAREPATREAFRPRMAGRNGLCPLA